jgi:hypothetical protein
VKFYADAEAVLAHLPRRGIAMILKTGRNGIAESYNSHAMARIVRKLRRDIGLPSTFTLDACRHGGMTELEEAELSDGQGRALSGHRTQRAYEGYAKTHPGTCSSGDKEAIRSRTGEHPRNIHSECHPICHSE